MTSLQDHHKLNICVLPPFPSVWRRQCRLTSRDNQICLRTGTTAPGKIQNITDFLNANSPEREQINAVLQTSRTNWTLHRAKAYFVKLPVRVPIWNTEIPTPTLQQPLSKHIPNHMFFLFAPLHLNSIQKQPASICHTLNNYQIPNPVLVISLALNGHQELNTALMLFYWIYTAWVGHANTLSLHVYLGVKEQVSHSYRGKLSLLMFVTTSHSTIRPF
jgi:hypothetical protein